MFAELHYSQNLVVTVVAAVGLGYLQNYTTLKQTGREIAVWWILRHLQNYTTLKPMPTYTDQRKV